MKTLILLILGFLSQTAQASDDWLCKEASVIKRGNSFYSCGIGEAFGDHEQRSREKAFEEAKYAFYQVCKLSSDCLYHKMIIEPKRTTCDAIPYPYDEITHHRTKGILSYQCYRLIVFTVLEERATMEEIVALEPGLP